MICQLQTDKGNALQGIGVNGAGIGFPKTFDNNVNDIRKSNDGLQSSTGNNAIFNTATPFFTIAANSTLTNSVAMTALVGRVPIDNKVTEPYPFKLLIGRDNLIANGIELPDIEGAIVSGTASGDWTLSCVRGDVKSLTLCLAMAALFQQTILTIKLAGYLIHMVCLAFLENAEQMLRNI